MNPDQEQTLRIYVMSLFLLMQCGPSVSRFSNSTVYESENGQIDAVSVDTTSGDLVLAIANSITRLTFDRHTNQTFFLKSGARISFIELLTSSNKSYAFMCAQHEKDCSILAENTIGSVNDASGTFPWTQDGSFILPLNQDAQDAQATKSGRLFVANNVENTFSTIFSLWNISYEPAIMHPLNMGLSTLKMVSPHTFHVMLGFQYNGNLYYLVRIKPRRKSRREETNLLQIDLTTAKNRIIATRLHCSSALVASTAYYLNDSPEILYASFETEDSQIICGFKMMEVEEYFQKVQEGCKTNRRGSRIMWLEEPSVFPKHDIHRGLNPCFKYKFGNNTRLEVNHQAIFAATSLYPTTTTTKYALATVENLVVYRNNNLTFGFVADKSENLSQVLLGVPGTLLYSRELRPARERGEKWTTKLRLVKNRLYIVRKNTVQYMDVESCNIHKSSVSCIRDITYCSWCLSSKPESCKTSEMCEKPSNYTGLQPSITSVEPSEGPISGGIVMTIHGTDLVMARTRSVTINNRNCDVIGNSITPSKFNCLVPSLSSDSNNFIRYTVPVLVTLDSKTFTPSPSEFTYLTESVVTSYTPWTSIVSGGTKLTLDGTNMHLIQHVKLTYFIGEEKVSKDEQLCNHGTEQLTCFTPSLVMDDQLPLNVSLRLAANDVTNGTGEIFYPLSSALQSSIFADPVIYGFKDQDSIVDRIDVDVNDNILVIKGNGFGSIMIDEFKVTIHPWYKCHPLNISEDEISCEIKGDPLPSSLYDSVKVQIGLYLLFYPGFVSFYNGSEENMPQPITKVYINTTEIVTNRTSVTTTITTNKTVVITNSSGSFIHRETNTEVLMGESTIDAVTEVTTPVSKPTQSTSIENTKATVTNFTSATKQDGNDRSEHSYSTDALKNNDNESDVNIIVSVLCVLTVSIVVLVLFRKPLIRKLKQKLSSRSRPGDAMSDGDRDDVSYSIAPGGVTYSLESLGGYTAETVLSDEDGDEDVRFLHFFKRFEDANLIISRDALKVEKIIGQGNFGSVYKGILTQNDNEVVVAVKTMHKNDSPELNIRAFLKEAYVMKHFHHENVLELLGVCVDDVSNPLVLLPFMPHGDLFKYLHDDNNIPTVKDLVCFGLDIANGMEHLAKLKFVHRDLAARNCMLDTNYHVKVADFGLSRDIYETAYYSSEKKGKLPVKWMALESLATGVFNEKTDVWAFGVTLWELMTRGVRPYAAVDNWDIEKYLRTGRRLPQPLFCPTHLYKLMRKCWTENPMDRPRFTTLKEWIATMLDRVEYPLGDTNHTTNIATTYVNVAMGSQYKYDPD